MYVQHLLEPPCKVRHPSLLGSNKLNVTVRNLLSRQNNIAEVEELQPDLLDEDLLQHVLALLQDSEVEISVRYFAGGILAQLASRPRVWTLSHELLAAIPEQLVGVWLQVSEGTRRMEPSLLTLSVLCVYVSVLAAHVHPDVDAHGERDGLLQVRGGRAY